MNYLAHVSLSCQNEHQLIGNFMADFLTLKESRLQPPSIVQGIELHKSIDQFTDKHPSVKSCVNLLRPTQGKYSPVVCDILFDYLLHKNWSKFFSQPLDGFVKNIYKILINNTDTYPQKLKSMLPLMISDDFLQSCKNEERLIHTFQRLKKRAKFDNCFEYAHLDLKNNESQLENHFLIFFPSLIDHVNTLCAC